MKRHRAHNVASFLKTRLADLKITVASGAERLRDLILSKPPHPPPPPLKKAWSWQLQKPHLPLILFWAFMQKLFVTSGVHPDPAGLHRHHIPPSALDRWAIGVWRQQESESRWPTSWAPLGPWHLHCGLQEVLPPWHHGGEQTDPHLPQRDRPLRAEVRLKTDLLVYWVHVSLVCFYLPQGSTQVIGWGSKQVWIWDNVTTRARSRINCVSYMLDIELYEHRSMRSVDRSCAVTRQHIFL